MRINKYLILISLIAFTTSCKKYLDEKNNKSLIVPSTLEDLQGILDDGALMNLLHTPSYGEACSDDYFLNQTNFNRHRESSRQDYLWVAHDYFFPGDWGEGYLSVYNSNLCLDVLTKIPITTNNQAKWNYIKGAALFFRAYNFLNLAWNYAKVYDEATYTNDLGIVLRLNSDFNESSIRSNVKETYERIIMDAMEATFSLPNISAHVMRPSKAAAYGLLARTYLSMGKYDSSLKYASLCLSIKNDLLNYDTEIDVNASLPFTQFNKETIFYSEMTRNFQSVTPGLSFIDTAISATYLTGDIRKSALFRFVAPFYRYKGTSTGNSSLLFSGLATDEMILIKAESNAKLNNKDAAMTDLNSLLVKRFKPANFVPITASTAAEAVTIIRLERRKELMMRGLRWIDIKRYNREGLNITQKRIMNNQTYTLAPNSSFYALPLPTDIIKNSSIQQN